MSNERSRGGRDGEGAFVGEADQDRTDVLVAQDFAAGAVGRLADGLQRAGLRCADAADLLRSGAGGAAAVDEVDADVRDLELVMAGVRRALARLKDVLEKNANKET